jgi:hypothetical protein
MKYLARFLADDMTRGRSPNTMHPGWKCQTLRIFRPSMHVKFCALKVLPFRA